MTEEVTRRATLVHHADKHTDAKVQLRCCICIIAAGAPCGGACIVLSCNSSLAMHLRPSCPCAIQTWLAGELILRCERQGLTQLPQQLWYKATVRQLILSGNALTSIPSDIGALKELRLLRLEHNLLEQLPEEVACLEHLETLELQHNQLQAVPAGLCT